MQFAFVCMPEHVYDHSDRRCTAIVIDFDVYWAALPTGRWHRLLAGRNCKVQEPWNRGQCTVTEAQNHDEGRGGRTVRGVHGSVMGNTEQKSNWAHQKTSGQRSVTGAWLHGLLQCMVCMYLGMGL